MPWTIQKACADRGEYELAVERQKTSVHCDQKTESWKWMVNYHGAQIASGNTNSMDSAKEMAEKNVPLQK